MELLNAPLTADGVATGDAVEARYYASAGTEEVTGLTVGLSGSNINISSVRVQEGFEVQIDLGSITAPQIFDPV